MKWCETGLVLVASALVAAGARAQTSAALPPLTSLVQSPAWRFLPSAAIAYDSFGQRYVIADEDTFDLVDEVSGRLVTALEHRGRTDLRLRNTLALGQEATRNDLQLWLQRRFSALELRLDQQLQYKSYTRNSDFVLSSDYLLTNTRVTGIWRPSPGWRLRLEDRFEWAQFETRTRYNYDYLLNDTGAEIERDYGLFSNLRLGYAFGRRSVPDSSAIDYRRHLVTSDWQHDLGGHGISVDQRLERRVYRVPDVRSHFLDYDGGIGGRISLLSMLRLRPEYRATLLRYDTPDSLYSDLTDHAVELLVEGDAGERTTIGLGPRGEFRRTQGGIDRAYDQWGLKGRIDFTAGTRFWIQFTEEIGTRKHQAAADDDELYSDYVFNWTTLYLSYEPLHRLTFDLFFSLNPENHTVDTSNTTTLLVSTSLTYGLR